MVAQMSYACTFCGQPEEAVRRLLVGPRGVYICHDCITLCHDIIAQPTGQDVQADTRADGTDVQVLQAELEAARAVIVRLREENAALRAHLAPPPTAD